MTWRCERAGSAHAAGLLELFEAAGSGCFCNYWHFEGDKNAWLERCYLHPDQNRAALEARLAAPELCGIVALEGEAVLGWLKVTPASTVKRLYDQRIYRNLPLLQGSAAEREGVYTIACCYVAEAQRGRGLLRQLLAAAAVEVRAAGGTGLEAFPRATPQGEPLRPDEVWMGPEALFLSAGFVAVSDFRPYPVLRLHLR